MKWLLLILASFSLTAASSDIGSSSKPALEKMDLTYFDTPLLLGDWYLINPKPEESEENFRAIKLTLESNYQFSIDIQKYDYSIEHWEGNYTASPDTIILGLNTDEPQVYAYSSNHNMLSLNGVTFTKGLSNSLAGMWSSDDLTGADGSTKSLAGVDLLLQPDFVFMFKVRGHDGGEQVTQGIYYTEGDHLVLLYENGEHDTRFELENNKLTLNVEDGDMLAVLNRIQ